MRKLLGRRSPSSIPALVAVHTTRVRALVMAVYASLISSCSRNRTTSAGIIRPIG